MNDVQTTAYLSLGSNLGDREQNLRTAIAKLDDVIAVSSFYETEPMEFTDQPWFLNCAVAVRANLTPQQLLAKIQAIEHDMHRRRIQPKGPRNIDLDILLFGDSILTTPELEIPHPAMHQRRFVLQPLNEIAPAARHPVLHKSVRELLHALPIDEGQVKKCKTP